MKAEPAPSPAPEGEDAIDAVEWECPNCGRTKCHGEWCHACSVRMLPGRVPDAEEVGRLREENAKLRERVEVDAYEIQMLRDEELRLKQDGARGAEARRKQVRGWQERLLVALAGAVATPEKGYWDDGGMQQALADVDALRKQHDALQSQLTAAEQAFTDLKRLHLATIDRCERLEQQLAECRSDLEAVNALAREYGYGQGDLDDDLAGCLRERLERLKAESMAFWRNFQEERAKLAECREECTRLTADINAGKPWKELYDEAVSDNMDDAQIQIAELRRQVRERDERLSDDAIKRLSERLAEVAYSNPDDGEVGRSLVIYDREGAQVWRWTDAILADNLHAILCHWLPRPSPSPQEEPREQKPERPKVGDLERSARQAADRLQELFNEADDPSDRYSDLYSLCMLANVVVKCAKAADLTAQGDGR